MTKFLFYHRRAFESFTHTRSMWRSLVALDLARVQFSCLKMFLMRKNRPNNCMFVCE